MLIKKNTNNILIMTITKYFVKDTSLLSLLTIALKLKSLFFLIANNKMETKTNDNISNLEIQTLLLIPGLETYIKNINSRNSSIQTNKY